MPKNLIKRNGKLGGDQSGFTIVELMIVLAVAALILVIALAVVPAVQRNARNNGRTADIRALQGQFATWAGNNGGKLPGAAAAVGTDVPRGIKDNIKLGFDWPTTSATAGVSYAQWVAATYPGVNLAWPDDEGDTLHIFRGAKCKHEKLDRTTNANYGAGGGAAILEDGPTNGLAFVYQLEGDENAAGNLQISCTDDVQ